MRSLLFTILVSLGPVALSQNWCPPGATWTYDYLGFVGIQGYTVMSYSGDTLLGGEVGQKISSYSVGVSVDQEIDTLIYPGWLITSHTGDLVSVWSGLHQSWDTLYNFAAGPGDSWAPPHSSPICGGAEFGDLVQVTDSGTVMVGGLALHYVDIHCGFNNGRIVERLGWSVGMFIAEGCWVPECQCDLRCYHDDVLDYVRPNVTVCDSIPELTTGENEDQGRSIPVFPNPGTDHFTLSLPPGPHTILLFDALGRTIHQEKVLGSTSVIGTAQFPAGIYVVLVDDALQPIRWVKE